MRVVRLVYSACTWYVLSVRDHDLGKATDWLTDFTVCTLLIVTLHLRSAERDCNDVHVRDKRQNSLVYMFVNSVIIQRYQLLSLHADDWEMLDCGYEWVLYVYGTYLYEKGERIKPKGV
jgi:hypothetical protein